MRTVYVEAKVPQPTRDVLIANANSQVESAHAINKVGNRNNYDLYKSHLASQNQKTLDKIQFQDACDDGELQNSQKSRDDIVRELQEKRKILMKQDVPCLRYLNPHANLPKKFGFS
jgi:hypothetical protein